MTVAELKNCLYEGLAMVATVKRAGIVDRSGDKREEWLAGYSAGLAAVLDMMDELDTNAMTHLRKEN